jgi:N-glycosylase/DNA lyase
LDASFVNTYFGLTDNLTEIFSEITKDDHINFAIQMFSGLRILRQEPWECLMSYICATFKNVSAIKKMIYNLCKTFGEKIMFDNYVFYSFPTPERIAKAKVQDLVKCGVGYRAKYLSESAKTIFKNEFDLNSLRKISYEDARKEIMCFPGVGFKVADCFLLFSLGRLESFPVDVRIKRAVLKYYSLYFPIDFIKKSSSDNSISSSTYKQINLFGSNYFGRYAGYAQEYLYHYEGINLK